MTEKQAIERIDNRLDMTEDDEIVISLLYQKIDVLEDRIKELGTALIDEDYKHRQEIEKYKLLFAQSTAERVVTSLEDSAKSKEDLEMLYKGCQIELKKKDAVIDEMAEYIAGLDIEEDICVKTGRLDECDSMNYGECENCIKEYFKKKVQKP